MLKSALLIASFGVILAFAGMERRAHAAPSKPQTFTIPLDAGVTAVTVEVSGKGRLCGPARVTDSNGRVLVALGAGQCVPAADR